MLTRSSYFNFRFTYDWENVKEKHNHHTRFWNTKYTGHTVVKGSGFWDKLAVCVAFVKKTYDVDPAAANAVVSDLRIVF